MHVNLFIGFPTKKTRATCTFKSFSQPYPKENIISLNILYYNLDRILYG